MTRSATVPPRSTRCQVGLALLVGFLAAPTARGYDLVGPENCKQCHAAAYGAWKDTQHARADASLTGRFAKDGRCLTCHSPESARGYAAVQCETCHGGGQFYYPRHVMRDAELARAVGLLDPTPAMCLKCHDAAAPSIRPFVFDGKVKLIDHWTAEREERKRLAEAAAAAAAEPPAATTSRSASPTSSPPAGKPPGRTTRRSRGRPTP